MAVLVGIDEAGYGPILGPLVVCSSSFSVPRELLTGDMWKVLRKSVGMTKKKLSGRVLIVDSKKAYTKDDKIKHLERTSLACFRCLEKEITTAGQLLRELKADSFSRLSGHKWYNGVERKKLEANFADIAIAGKVLGQDMEKNGIRLLKIEGRCLEAGYYNEVISKVRNKAKILFSTACELIKDAFDSYGDDDLQIIVDRQGGTIKYGPSLQRMFGPMQMTILKESPAISSYEVEKDGKKMRLHFVVKADVRFLPVSLGSMVSKYVRELLMDEINRYFSRICPELKPTAGYWKDGTRFLKDLKAFGIEGEYEKRNFVRSR